MRLEGSLQDAGASMWLVHLTFLVMKLSQVGQGVRLTTTQDQTKRMGKNSDD